MKTEIVKVDEIRYVCDLCGSTSKYPYMTEKCEINCKEKLKHDVCKHDFFLDIDVDIDSQEIDISRRCKKCDYIENTNSISVYSIKDYLAEDAIEDMYNNGE